MDRDRQIPVDDSSERLSTDNSWEKTCFQSNRSSRSCENTLPTRLIRTQW